MSARLAVIGLWHQGVVGAACHADWGHDVLAADHDAAKIAKLSLGKAPLFEPGLDELLGQGVASGRLRFSTTPAQAVQNRPFVLIAFDTPVDADDQSDLTEIFQTIDEITPSLADGVVIYVTAQVPVGTCGEIANRIKRARPSLKFGIAYSPENLRLGQAIALYRKPPLPVLGSDDPWVFQLLEDLYAPCGVKWEHCSLRTAEMSKHALNGYLALSVCFANELGNLCDMVGADGHRLAEILRLEPRIGSKAMLFPGLGFSGGTLARDMQTLRGLGDKFGIETQLLDGAWNSNQQQNRLVVRQLKRHFGGSVKGRSICVLGLTYKPGTSTLRRSAALEVISELAHEGAEVSASDPKADRVELAAQRGFTFHEDALDAVRGADALVLMTPWAEFKALDFSAVRSAMRGDLVYDTANLWPADAVAAAGLRYLDIGRGRAARR
jgi:UDPglucose 6-dehydrogenase